MRREVKILLVTVAAGGVWAGRQPLVSVLDDMELFRVREIQFRGLRYLERSEATRLLGITDETSIWGDVDAWRQALEAHPMVRSARISRRVPGRLDVSIVERVPVGLVATPTFEAVDADGARLPLDPAGRRLDLPVLLASGTTEAGSRLLPEPVPLLAREVARLAGADTSFLRLASEVSLIGPGSLSVRWTGPEVELLLPVGAPASRLREGLMALDDAAGRDPRRSPKTIDLRYSDQVVVRFER